MAAPKGNLYALGNNGGRPPKYETPQEMFDKITEYIQYCDECKGGNDSYGKGKGIYTLEGCALFLGFATVKSFYDYEQKGDEFLYVLQRYRLFVAEWNVNKLYWGGTFAGAMFWLKNHGGYTDETIQHQKQEITEVKITEKTRDE